MLPGWRRCHAGSELQDWSFYGSGSCDVRGHAHPQEKKEKCVTARSDVCFLCPCKNSPSDDFSLMKNRCSGNLSHMFILQHLLNRKRFFFRWHTWCVRVCLSSSHLLKHNSHQQEEEGGRRAEVWAAQQAAGKEDGGKDVAGCSGSQI